jgi:hypothetical protein
MRVLQLLAARPGEIVTRDELQRDIWGDDTFVDFDAGLSTCINQVRTALGDRAASPRFIETVPRRGYRFIAPLNTDLPLSHPRRSSLNLGAWAPTATLFLIVLVALLIVRRGESSEPVPILVTAVDVDASTPQLEPVSRSFTHALTGTLATAMGSRGRVASPSLVAQLSRKPLPEMANDGIEYAVLVTLRSLDGPVLVHIKLVHYTGWVKWASDEVVPLEQLRRDQLKIAAKLSRQLALQFTRG